jgi:hypothetical protein
VRRWEVGGEGEEDYDVEEGKRKRKKTSLEKGE